MVATKTRDRKREQHKDIRRAEQLATDLEQLAQISPEELERLSESQDMVRPQSGPQELFLRSSVDIAIYGGAAGGGKSYAALLEPLYHVHNPGFEAVIFRRTFKQIAAPGGLWERSMEIYPQVGGKPNAGTMSWTFPSGAKVRFSHMQHEQDVLSWKGSEITLIEFDELTDFSEYMFFYMLSRNRSLCGIKPYMRGYTNPDSESWVKPLLGPWVDPDWPAEAEKQGWPEPYAAQSGEVRYFVRENGILRWCEATEKNAKSITFVAANIFDNKILLEKDPAYLDNLAALPDLEKQRLLLGSWTIRPSGKKFKREWFKVVDEPPHDIISRVRFWDLAATEVDEEALLGQKRNIKSGPDYTAGVLVGRTARNTFIILHAVWFRKSPMGVAETIREIADLDGPEVSVWMEQEGGASGVNTIDEYRRGALINADFHALRQSKNKLMRGNIVASHAEMGTIQMLRGPWNDGFMNFLMAFPNPRVHDDAPDAFFSAMGVLLTNGENIPFEVSGTSQRPWYQKLPNERVYQPAIDEMSEEQREALLARQDMISRFLQQIRVAPAHGVSVYRPQLEEPMQAGDWI